MHRRNQFVQGSRILLITLAIVIANGVHAFAANDAMDKPRLEKMLTDGDAGMITQIFKRYPGQTLPFIDSYLEGGLAMIEKGEDSTGTGKALESFRTGIKFARLADEAFGGDTFSDYANSFSSWSPTEQKNFREGQRAYKAGMKEPDAKKALNHLRRSLMLAKPLGDTWGQAMAQQGIAEKALASSDFETARSAAMIAAELNSSVRLQSDAVESLRILAKTFGDDPHDLARHYLAQAWAIADEDPSIDPPLRETVLNEYLASLAKQDQTEMIEQLNRNEAARKAAQQSKEGSGPT
jgi:hypothetical protein